MTAPVKHIPSVSVTYADNGRSTAANELGMRPMQERAYEKRGEQYLLIKSPPASGKSRALMFIALDKLHNQGLRQAIIVVPEKSIDASFNDEPLSRFGFFADWRVPPKWNLCNAPGEDGGKMKSVKAFLDSDDQTLVCTHATFRFAVDQFGVEAFDNRLIAVDEFHHVSANPDNKLGAHLGQFIARDRVHVVAMTGSYFRGDAEAVLAPRDEARFDTVTYTYYEQLNGYQYLKQLDIGYFFYTGSYAEDILKVLDPSEKTILHIPNVNSRESTKDKIREVEHIIDALGDWQGTDPATGFQLVKTPEGRLLRIADLVDDDPAKRDRVAAALKDPTHKHNRDHVDRMSRMPSCWRCSASRRRHRTSRIYNMSVLASRSARRTRSRAANPARISRRSSRSSRRCSRTLTPACAAHVRSASRPRSSRGASSSWADKRSMSPKWARCSRRNTGTMMRGCA
jgi:hypothetical protein